MKLFLILFALSFFSSQTFSAELYCKSKAGLESKLPDPKVMSAEEYKNFKKFLVDHYNILWMDSCIVEESPELYKLYKTVGAGKYDPKKSDFESSAYAVRFIESQKPKFDLSWSLFDSPFELISFPTWIARNKASVLANGKLNKESLDALVLEYKGVLAKRSGEKSSAAPTKLTAAEEEAKRLQEEKAENERYHNEEMMALYNEHKAERIDSTYVINIIEKGEGAMKDVDDFIKRHLADNKEDFYRKLVFACYNMDCDEKIKTTFKNAINNKINFKVYDDLSIFSILIMRNRVEEVKKFLTDYPEFKVNELEFSRSAHIPDSKIYNYLKYEKGLNLKLTPIYIDRNVLQNEIPSNSLSEVVNDVLAYSRELKHYSAYFFNKNEVTKSRHMIGYALFDNYIDPEVAAFAKKQKLVGSETIDKDYVFSEPNWNSKRSLLRNKDGKILPEFRRENMFLSVEGIEFDEVRNNWFGFSAGKTKYWMHRSQPKNFFFVDSVADRWTIFKGGDAVYSDIGGTKLNINLSGTENHAFLLQTRWLNDELWMRVNLMRAPCSGKDRKKEVFDVWIKAFNPDNKANFTFPKSC